MYIRTIGIAGLILGLLFKILHWPGGNYILLVSGSLALVALSILLIQKPGPWSIPVPRPGILFAALAAVFAGSLFKAMYWPGANMLLLVGMTTCTVWVLMSPWKRAVA